MDQFVDMLRNAQDGKGLENLARICGLSMQQAQATAEAVMPALLDAFRDMTRSPDSMAALTNLMLGAPYAALYGAQPSATPYPASAPQAAPAPQNFGMPGFPPAQPRNMPGEQPLPLTQGGMNALNTIFGSPEVSKAVANQVAASTGLSAAVVKQAMPALAGLFVGTLAKTLAASGSLQQMAAAMLSRMPVGEPQQRMAPISSGNPWMDAFLAFSSTASNAAPYGGAGNPWQNVGQAWGGSNPWMDAFSQSMRLAAPPAPQQPATTGWQDVVNAMTQTMAQTGAAPYGHMPQPPAPPPAPAAPPTMAAPAAAPQPPAQGQTSAPSSNPFADMQDLFAQMLVQGFQHGLQQGLQPSSSGARTADGQSLPLSPMDFWLELVKQAQEANQKTISVNQPRPSGKHEKSGKKSDK
ncbi:DUF937 domain-containing protein [Xanthobacter sp. TB0136]|uniref:DUF937 domain-containing protein n=1 Tax=Xanthobacter sp. TB0136 TaxID=3459177 RepID=UPI00403A2421